MPTRQHMWDKLDGTFDLLVIGGGITGSGIARDAARRGLSVAVVESRDLASGTSSRSSKLVHGGLRYLEMYEFSLVFEAVSERKILMDIAPHLVHPLGFLFPVYQDSRKPRWMINAGMWVYEGLSLFRVPKMHQNLDAEGVKKEEPALKQEGLSGAPKFYDCSTDDARLTLETALDAVQSGAVVATYTKLTGFLFDESGVIRGATVVDQRTGQTKEILAHAVVNATGPWTDATRALSAVNQGTLLRPTKGVHIVVENARLPINNAVVCFHPKDKRVLFAIPWGDRTYIGTTDTDYQGDPADVHADAADVAYLIDASNSYFPDHKIGPEDVISTWAGLRPLIAPSGSDVGESQVSREHSILVGRDRLITIAGGKLTTYRRMAAEVVDTAVRLLQMSGHKPQLAHSPKTDTSALPGAVGWPADDDASKVAVQIADAAGGRLGDDTCLKLALTYGMRGIQVAKRVAGDAALAERLVPGRPEILAQVDWAIDEELAATCVDLMIRRTQLFYRDLDQGLGAIDKVAERMAKKLGWDDAKRAAEAQAYRDEVALARRWKQG